MQNTLQTVGVAFIKDNSLLVVQSVRSSKTNSYTFIGGGVEEGESLIDAAIREISEEIGNGFTITEDDLEPILHFSEAAASDANVHIEMHIFISHKEVDVELITNDEILDFKWYKPYDISINVSSSIRDHFIPYAIKKDIMQ